MTGWRASNKTGCRTTWATGTSTATRSTPVASSSLCMPPAALYSDPSTIWPAYPALSLVGPISAIAARSSSPWLAYIAKTPRNPASPAASTTSLAYFPGSYRSGTCKWLSGAVWKLSQLSSQSAALARSAPANWYIHLSLGCFYLLDLQTRSRHHLPHSWHFHFKI